MSFDNISAFGAKFIVEPSGTVLLDSERLLLQELKPAGIMFRKRNFMQGQDYATWLSAYDRLLNQCKDAIGRERLIVSIDHEGGRVIRPPLPITPFPYAANWADSVVPVSEAMAIELKSLGINVNFAPVADIHSNPNNPVINERAFGTSAEDVAKAVRDFAANMMENQVFPCAKHFPGHGDTKQDSHFGLPVAESTLEELAKRELVPFQTLIDDGIEMVMTAHILFPKIDPENQATVSKKILHDLLREKMGFRGVIIADALGMKAISAEEYGTTVRGLNAGLDLFLVAGDNVNLESALRIAEHMRDAVAKGDVSGEQISQSIFRIDRLLELLPQHPVCMLGSEIFKQHSRLASELEIGKVRSAFDLKLPGFE